MNWSDMREIKLRYTFKRLSDGFIKQVWVKLEYFESRVGEIYNWINHEDWGCIGKDLYTSLKDKNGKEIYEGDIVSFDIQDYNGIDHFYKSEVYYWGSCFSCDTDKSCIINLDNALADDEDIEIIGNIYENPELIKE